MSRNSGQNEPPYIHGTSPAEQQRLSLLNTLLNDACLSELNLRGGERIIDFGSGLAQFARDMARAAGPAGRVIGIERSPEQLLEAMRQARQVAEERLVDLRAGDVYDPPLETAEWGTYDLAFARFVLEHVADPLSVVSQMVRAVRPGGRIVLADDDHDLLRLWPEPTGLSELWQAYIRSYDCNGTDGLVGRKLVSLLHAAGARPVRNTLVFFGSCSGNSNFEGFVENLAGVILTSREAMLKAGLFNEERFDKTIAELRAWGRRPDAAFWYGLSWAEGVKSSGE